MLSSAAVVSQGQGDPAALEAEIFSRYLVGRAAPAALVERYRDAGRAIWAAGAAPAEESVVAFVRRHPWAVGPLDAATSLLHPGGYLRSKILTMAAILEASPAFADEFLPRSVSGARLAWQVVAGGAAASLQALAGMLLLPLARRGQA